MLKRTADFSNVKEKCSKSAKYQVSSLPCSIPYDFPLAAITIYLRAALCFLNDEGAAFVFPEHECAASVDYFC